MKNFIWIASYPKSGNTMIRLFLALYFFTEDGVLKNFDVLKNIISLNRYSILNKINNPPKINSFKDNPELISNYWKKIQEKISKDEKNKIFFIKTHNAKITYNNFSFTNLTNTKSFLYVVRDPRSVLLSMIDHYGFKNFKESKKYLISENACTTVKGDFLPEILLSWKSHYNSWNNFNLKNPNLGLIIRYEDMVKSSENTFLKIINFINDKMNIEFNEKKFLNSLESINFNNLKTFEDKLSFPEVEQKNQKFFRKGIIDEWKSTISLEILQEINKIFDKEMRDLDYL